MKFHTIENNSKPVEVGKPTAISLRIKVLAILVVSMILIFGLRGFLIKSSIERSFSTLETVDAAENAARVVDALRQRTSTLETKARDWANWTDLWDYAKTEDQAFAKSNLMGNVLQSLHINYLFIHNRKGKKLYAAKFNLHTNQSEELSEDEYRKLSKIIPGMIDDNVQAAISGILGLDGRHINFTSQPLHRTDGTGESHGTIIMAQVIDESVIKQIGETAHISARLTKPKVEEDFETQLTQRGKGFSFATDNYYSTQVIKVSIPDINGKNHLDLYVQLPREIAAFGRGVARSLILTSIFLGLLVLFVVWFSFDWLVLRRVARLSKEMTYLSSNQSDFVQISEGIHDELGHLARTANALLMEKDKSSKALRIAHSELSRYISAIPFALIIFDYEGRMITCNDFALSLFEKLSDSTGEVFFWDLPLGRTRETLLNDMLQAWTHDTPVSLPTASIVTKEGVRYFDVLLNIVDMGDGVGRFLLSAIDITTQQSLQVQLLQSQKMESIGLLAAGIAHEINTPTQYVTDNIRFLKEASGSFIRIIAQNAAFLEHFDACKMGAAMAENLRNLLKDEDYEYYNEQIPCAIDQSIEGLSRIATIVKAMKEFSHPGDDSKTLVDLNHAIQSTVNVSRNEWKYVADLELDLDNQIPLVKCTVNEINQVILNMIVNASHAIGDKIGKDEPKGSIKITTRSLEPDFVEVLIQDTGGGIPKSIQSKVFDPFFTTKEVGKGTGQGLSIAHNIIVTHHNGKIDIESVEGEGTTFHILLPIDCESKNQEATAA